MMMIRSVVRKIINDPFKPQYSYLQEYLFRLALNEIGVRGGTISVDHHSGTCTHEKTGTIPLVFPMAYVNKVANMGKQKTRDYFFQGVITEKRAWLREYDNVIDSNYGRIPDKKFHFHTDYYQGICSSKFALAPTGDCPWSYRFLEGVMCFAIPVLGDEDVDLYAGPFVHFRHSDEKSYDLEACRSNYDVFLANHTLSGLKVT